MALGGTRDQRKVNSRARRRLKARAADTHSTQAESVEQRGKDMGVSTQTMVEQGILLHPGDAQAEVITGSKKNQLR